MTWGIQNILQYFKDHSRYKLTLTQDGPIREDFVEGLHCLGTLPIGPSVFKGLRYEYDDRSRTAKTPLIANITAFPAYHR